ncbi:MAG: DNA methyltransferase [Candidatus Auribacterota bacterium]|jgi:DNA modification methylase|nr:DNA methyltransferase [Candidatus Auribacterota bacterium]
MTKINTKPEIFEVKLADLKPAPYNPREISEEAMAGLRHSLEKFGLVDLLVVNKRNMHIISGHQRYKILQAENVESVTAIMVDLDDIAEKAMNVTLNSQEIAGYWTSAITPLLEKLRRDMADDYIALRMKELREELSEFEPENMGAGKTLPDDIPEPPKEPITRPGDLWILGGHRLLCGDSTNPKDVAQLMDGQKASLFATDPPYCVDYTGKDRPNGGKDWSDVYRETEIKDAVDFMRKFYTVALNHIQPNTAMYLWHASKRRYEIQMVCDELDILVHQQIIWVKPCTILTYSFYSWRHEPCLLMWVRGSKPPYKPKDKSIGTVWRVDFLKSGDPASPDYYTDVWELDWEGKKRNPGIDHPTVKPTEVFAIPMRVHTNVGDICYEPFSGSGSQIIAGERVNRRVFAMEMEPVFCDVAIKRWQDFTGMKAVRV